MLALLLKGSVDRPTVNVECIDEPREEAGRVMVDVVSAGVTRTEPNWSTSWDADGAPRKRPVVLGLEFAGHVRSVGPGVEGFAIGQKVMGLAEPSRGGAIAEMISAPADRILAMPDRLYFEDASVLPLAGSTAWQGLLRHGKLEKGQHVLIQGGAGGVGAFATQIARRTGARVTVTAAARHAPLCERLGADEVVDFEHDRFERYGRRYDLVFDQIGGDVLERSWDVLKPGGRLVTIAGEKEPDQARADALGVTATYFVIDSNLAELAALGKLVADGAIRAVIGRKVRLARAPEAFEPASGMPGKTVVTCIDSD